MRRRLLERGAESAALRAAAADAAAGRGRVVLLHGEAGIGKTSLVAALREDPPAGVRVLVGSCDAMSTPRTLGPLRDLAPAFGARLRAALSGADREEVYAAMQQELVEAPGTVLVIEDAHWADEATLDVLRFVARRIDLLPTALVVTYRDELERDHPLTRLLGDIGQGDRTERIAVPRLSAGAVGALTEGSGLDADRVYAMTDGNPYFVSELVASAGDADEMGVPPTVVDAVIGRMRRLDAATQAHLEQLAVVPSIVDPGLSARLVSGGTGALRSAEEGGLLTVRPEGVLFRHELTRRAVVDALPGSRRIELEQRVLAELVGSGIADPARIVHHALGAGDVDAVVEWAPRAAREAAASGAHRQAAAHFAAALEHPERYPDAELADLFEGRAIESYTIGSALAAVAAQSLAVDVRRRLGDPVRLGASLRWLSRFDWFAGLRADAELAAAEASAVLADAGDAALLALARSNEAQLALLAHDSVRAFDLAEEAIALARDAGDRSVLSHALNNHGASLLFRGRDEGLAELIEAADVALSVDDVENASRAYVNLVWNLLDDFRLDEAEVHLARAEELTARSEFIGFAIYQRMERARLELARARWDDALAAAEPPPDPPHARCVALTVAGTARLRRGDPGAEAILDEAWRVADELDELQRRGPVASARAEAALLRGDPEAAVEIALPSYEEAVRREARSIRDELASLLHRAGHRVDVPDGDEHPFAVQARGDWREAAACWRAAGCPYHEAAALAESPDATDQLDALVILDRIGAVPLAKRVRSALREQGVRGVPRGPSTVTRGNPLGLTDRQADVLRLLADGLTNAEIADRLVVSVRTVDSHVAAVLAKLGVSSRREAARAARDLGSPTA